MPLVLAQHNTGKHIFKKCLLFWPSIIPANPIFRNYPFGAQQNTGRPIFKKYTVLAQQNIGKPSFKTCSLLGQQNTGKPIFKDYLLGLSRIPANQFSKVVMLFGPAEYLQTHFQKVPLVLAQHNTSKPIFRNYNVWAQLNTSKPIFNKMLGTA